MSTMLAKPKKCDCPLFVSCVCEFEATVADLDSAFNSAIWAAAHGGSCARFECGQCSCDTRVAMDKLADQVLAMVKAGRKALAR